MTEPTSILEAQLRKSLGMPLTVPAEGPREALNNALQVITLTDPETLSAFEVSVSLTAIENRIRQALALLGRS